MQFEYDLYNRAVNRKVFSLRLIFAILLIALFVSFTRHNSNLSYLLSVVIIFLGFINLTDLNIDNHSIEISKYYLFAFVKLPNRFASDQIVTIKSRGQELESKHFNPPPHYLELEYGCLYTVFQIINPSKVSHQKVEITFSENEKYRKVNLFVNRAELDLLLKKVKSKMHNT